MDVPLPLMCFLLAFVAGYFAGRIAHLPGRE